LFKQSAGVDMLHVPYRGGAPAVVDLLAGRVDVMFGNLPDFIGQLRDGGLRPIAACGERTSSLLPNLPLISRDLPGYSVSNWFGLAAPKDLPPAILQAWTRALLKVRDDPEFQRRMNENGMEVLLGTPEEKQRTIAADKARWGEVIRRANIRADQ
jgi:tripartite-type tricarboxylate transporter receptor subunit TctC